MPLVNAKEIIEMAEKENAAVIAFIVNDHNMAAAVIRAAEKMRRPALIMLLPEYATTRNVPGFESFVGMVAPMAKKAAVPIAIHLDHSYDEKEVYAAIDAGFTSVMFDASRDDLETNIKRTKAVVDYAHARGVYVESELGAVGIAMDHAGENQDFYTKPETVKKFCEETGVDTLAIAIGNAHGDYPFPPKLDLQRLDEINAITNVPLVLHGGSGIPDDQLVEAFGRGINKFNYGTDVLRCYNRAVRAFMETHQPPASADMLELPAYVQQEMAEFIAKKMELSRLIVE